MISSASLLLPGEKKAKDCSKCVGGFEELPGCTLVCRCVLERRTVDQQIEAERRAVEINQRVL